MKNDMDRLVPQEIINLARFCKAAMLVINARLFTLLALMLTACMFFWVLWEPDWIRFAAACAFAILGLLPVQKMEARREISTKEQSDG